MPIYEYRCDNGHHFDVMQKMTDGPVTECEVCGAPVQRVFHPVAVHFKGSGFYNTDYGTATPQARDGRVRQVRRRLARRQAGREEVRQLVDVELLVVFGLVVLVVVLDAAKSDA